MQFKNLNFFTVDRLFYVTMQYRSNLRNIRAILSDYDYTILIG